ncbi:MAG: efflux RND transporter periplasmic adaptor subunit [Planctomycetota bacterium]|nr:MAG: efflux RND transporter periplasmic adaptor subunit [Planctomycetota bacterium]
MKQALPFLVGGLIVGAFMGLLLGFVWSSLRDGDAADEEREMPPAQVVTENVRSGSMEEVFRTSGALRAPDTVHLRSLVAGFIKEVGFYDGMAVDAGQVLLQVEDAETREDLAAAEAARNEARRQWQRAQELEKESLGTSNETARRHNDYLVAQAQVAAARARLADYQLSAPFPGRVGLREVSAHAPIAVGDAVATLTRMDPLRVRTAIPERYASQVRTGITVRVFSQGSNDSPLQGTVVFVAPVIDPATRTLLVEAEVANADESLRPGQSVRVEVALRTLDAVITVPEEAVVLRGSAASLWVVRDGRALSQAVTLGSSSGGRVVIREGLTDGDEVVVRGLQKIFFPGMPVAPRQRANDADEDPS